ncbi:MAG: hypothetical protein JRJ38_10575 [Deltaproteobacteria bacterium]|nr:hypothetical protein [Deltaproteobacteria bacterium]
MASIKKTASLLKLHFFSWAMRSEKNMAEAIKFSKQTRSEFVAVKIWNVEPSLNRALAYAIAEGIIELNGGRYHLASKGENLLRVILEDEQLLISEKKFLNTVKKKISEAHLQRLSKWWENKDA